MIKSEIERVMKVYEWGLLCYRYAWVYKEGDQVRIAFHPKGGICVELTHVRELPKYVNLKEIREAFSEDIKDALNLVKELMVCIGGE